jgi:hypothetical protein
MTTEQIARVCHEANRSYCVTQGDNSQLAWEDAAEWQRKSAITGVQYVLDNPNANSADQHQCWLDEKIKDGWVYGLVKDAERKLHPCIVPYNELPEFQQKKDALFRAIVDALK